MDYDEKVGIQVENVVEKRMSGRAAVHFGRALFVPLVLLSAAAVAGPLGVVPQPTVTTPSLAAVPAPVNSLPVVPSGAGLSSPVSMGAMNIQGPAALPGLDSVTDTQRKQSATRTGISTNGIRPIRVPPNVLPVTLPLATGS